MARLPGRPWSDQAVLVRTHAQVELIAEALRAAGIPHRVRGGASFLDRPEVRRALRELRSSNAPLVTALADLEAQIDAREAALAPASPRSEERRVGKECVSTCRSRWSPAP